MYRKDSFPNHAFQSQRVTAFDPGSTPRSAKLLPHGDANSTAVLDQTSLGQMYPQVPSDLDAPVVHMLHFMRYLPPRVDFLHVQAKTTVGWPPFATGRYCRVCFHLKKPDHMCDGSCGCCGQQHAEMPCPRAYNSVNSWARQGFLMDKKVLPMHLQAKPSKDQHAVLKLNGFIEPTDVWNESQVPKFTIPEHYRQSSPLFQSYQPGEQILTWRWKGEYHNPKSIPGALRKPNTPPQRIGPFQPQYSGPNPRPDPYLFGNVPISNHGHLQQRRQPHSDLGGYNSPSGFGYNGAPGFGSYNSRPSHAPYVTQGYNGYNGYNGGFPHTYTAAQGYNDGLGSNPPPTQNSGPYSIYSYPAQSAMLSSSSGPYPVPATPRTQQGPDGVQTPSVRSTSSPPPQRSTDLSIDKFRIAMKTVVDLATGNTASATPQQPEGSSISTRSQNRGQRRDRKPRGYSGVQKPSPRDPPNVSRWSKDGKKIEIGRRRPAQATREEESTEPVTQLEELPEDVRVTTDQRVLD